jgi:O-antigen ligase
MIKLSNPKDFSTNPNQYLVLILSFLAISLFFKAGFMSAGMILVTLAGLISFRKNKFCTDFKNNKKVLLLFGLFAIYLLAAVFSEKNADTFDSVIKKIPLLLIPLGVLFIGSLDNDIHRTVFKSYVFACFVASLVCLIWAIVTIISNNSFSIVTPDRKYYYFSYLYLTSPLGITPIYLSLLFNMASLILFYKQTFRSKSIQYALILWIGVFIFLIASKVGIIALIIISILKAYAFIKNSVHKKIAILIIPVAIILVGLSIYKLPFLKERFLASFKFDYHQEFGHLWTSNGYRLAIWSCTFETVKKEPLFGFGPGNGQKALQNTFREKGFIWGVRQSFNAHNDFLSIMLDVGIVGVLILVVLILWSGFESFKLNDMFSLSFIIMITTYFMTESILLRQRGLIFISFFYSLLLYKFPNKEKKL